VRLAVVVFVIAGATVAAAPAQRGYPDCIDVWGEARYRNYGYDHIVHVENRCTAIAICDVATNVNPSPERTTVAPRQAVEVLTFRGSPSREFVPRVECSLTSD
jgi:hypothetical protein